MSDLRVCEECENLTADHWLERIEGALIYVEECTDCGHRLEI